MALREIGGQATINLHVGPAQGMSREALEDRLEIGPQQGTTTYRAGGDYWFVLSGFYGGELKDTIFIRMCWFSPIPRHSRPSRSLSLPRTNPVSNRWWSTSRTISRVPRLNQRPARPPQPKRTNQSHAGWKMTATSAAFRDEWKNRPSVRSRWEVQDAKMEKAATWATSRISKKRNAYFWSTRLIADSRPSRPVSTS